MKLVFLGSSQPLTKSFSLDSEGQLVKGSYPLVSDFTSYEETVDTLKDFARVTALHADKGHCLLKGLITRPLSNESRAGSTDSETPTEWLCLDFDGAVKLKDADEFLNSIDALRNVDYVLQYSASHGIDKNKQFSAHLFMRLAKPQMPSYIKTWLKHLNLTSPMLSAGLTLTRTGMALRWPLDITTCQNDKLIYIAPPLLGKGIGKPRGELIRYVKGKHRTVDFDAISVNAEIIATKTTEAIRSLRDKAGLPPHRLATRIDKRLGIEIMPRPGKATVTGIREGRGFMYLNLNGGDSWGYYHPIGKPDIIYNFKGEPAYKAEELVPEYYAKVINQANPAAPDPHNASDDGGLYYLAFLDKQSDIYHRGTYDSGSGEIVVYPTQSVRKLNDFLLMHGQAKPDIIPEWDYEFRYDDPRSIDIEHRFINRYQPTRYMGKTKAKTASLPPGIGALLLHVMPSSEAVERFLNWLAVIYQHRIKPGTAWVWTGTQGTGKGLLFSRVLRPIFGDRYCKEIDINQLDETFNGYLEESILLMIDEAQRDSVRNEEKVLSRLKHFITESHISIRKMHTNHYTARNYTSVIIASNEQSPVFIAYNDRRMNVAPHQPEQLKITEKQIAQLDAELDNFATYLASRTADIELARRPLLNKARSEMMERTQKTADRIADELTKGNFEYFLDSYTPPAEVGSTNQQKFEMATDYQNVLRSIAERMLIDPNVKVWREQIRTIFEHLIGAMPMGVSKFGQFLGHHGIHYERLYNETKGASHQGIIVRWRFNEKEVRAFLKDPAERLVEQEKSKVTSINKAKRKKSG